VSDISALLSKLSFIKENGLKVKQDLEEELRLYEQPLFMDSGHWSVNSLFFSRQRNWLKNEVQKIRFYGYLCHMLKKKPYRTSAKILIAPVGDGSDIKYLEGIYKEVHGIDISDIQLRKCPQVIIAKKGNILDSGYETESFDIVITSLFFHHLHEVGFTLYAKELFRVLRKGGVMAVLEPSALYPFSWVMAILSKLLGGFPGKVKGERPLLPGFLIKELKSSGFDTVITRGTVLNHICFPFFVQSIINLLDWPFRILWPFRLCTETVGFYCEKK
jgi:SAM-dependent methyltransferase